jgi:sec-independent protein translocase protein TatB
MFDISFTELLIIAVVALLVVGPERLPKVARTAGLLLGRLQRYVSDVKSDISREMQLEELKRVQRQVEDTARDMESSVHKELSTVEESMSEAWTITDERPATSTSASTSPPRETSVSGKDADVAESAAAHSASDSATDTATSQLDLGLDQQAPTRSTS